MHGPSQKARSSGESAPRDSIAGTKKGAAKLFSFAAPELLVCGLRISSFAEESYNDRRGDFFSDRLLRHFLDVAAMIGRRCFNLAIQWSSHPFEQGIRIMDVLD